MKLSSILNITSEFFYEERGLKLDHTTEHEAHSHECGHSCSHSHDISLTDDINAGPNLAHLLPTIFGVIGIIAGLVLQNMGHQSYPIPFILAAVVAGYPVANEGFKALCSGRGLDINLLTTVAGLGAILLGEYAEAAAVLTLFSIGEYLEESAGEKSRRSIRAMMDLAPLKAHVKTDEGLTDIPAENVELGDVVMIFPGEKIPVDGKVIMGRSSVDESIISGESMPVEKEPGSAVLAGSMNADGSLEVVVTSRAEDTTISQIIEMIEESQSKKARTQKTVDRFAKIWTPLMQMCIRDSCMDRVCQKRYAVRGQSENYLDDRKSQVTDNADYSFKICIFGTYLRFFCSSGGIRLICETLNKVGCQKWRIARVLFRISVSLHLFISP